MYNISISTPFVSAACRLRLEKLLHVWDVEGQKGGGGMLKEGRKEGRI
jgi:hypothetical protein